MKALYELWADYNLQELLLIGSLIMMRLIPLTVQTPFLGGKVVPAETRIGLSVGLALFAYPYAVLGVVRPFEPTAELYIALMFKELFVGFVIGFIATELFFAMEIGGRAVDVVRGSNMAEVQVPELALRASPLGQFNFQLLLVLFCTIGGHTYFIESVVESYRVVAVDKFPIFTAGFGSLIDAFLVYTASLFKISFALVFPGIFAAFLVDIVFGMFNRIAPQLNAYFMAMGIKAMAGIAMFMLAMTLMIDELQNQLQHSLLFVRKIIGLFG